MHLSARLRELEAEADTVRAELAEMDNLAQPDRGRAIYRLCPQFWPPTICPRNYPQGLLGRRTGGRHEAIRCPSADAG
jgi:hypothetical protein